MTHAGPQATGSPDVTTPLPVVAQSVPVEVRQAEPDGDGPHVGPGDDLDGAQPPSVPVRVSVRGGAVPTSAPAPATVTILCPRCSRPSTVTLSRRDATAFCDTKRDGRTCDYPLFWARPQDAVGAPDGDVEPARRRSPGTAGADRLVSVPCPACAELNVPGDAWCLRCGAEMTPPPPALPVPVPLPEPVPEPVVVREPEPAEPFPLVWLAAMLTIAGAAWAVSAFLG